MVEPKPAFAPNIPHEPTNSPVQNPQGGALLNRHDTILQAVVFAAEAFLESSDWESSVPQVLERLGIAAGAGRAYIFENHLGTDGSLMTSQRHEWVAPGISAEIDNTGLQNLSFRESGLGRWEKVLGAGEIIQGIVAELPECERNILEGQQIHSIALVPIFLEAEWWGFVGFDDCAEERIWSPPELAALRAAANLFGTALDHGRVNTRLRESEERFQRLTEATVEGIMIHDEATVIDGNPRLSAMLGYSLDQIIGKDPLDFVAPDDRDGVRSSLAADSTRPYETVALRYDGSRFPVEVRGSAIRIRSGTAGIVAIRDLSERKQAERDLQESQRALATLMANLPGMAYRCRNDRHWTMEYVSEGAFTLTGYASAELVANREVSYGDLIRPEDREPVIRQVQDALAEKQPFRTTYRIRPADGEERWVWEQGCGVFSADGELQALEGFITDITEAKRAEESVRRLLVEQTARAAAEAAEERAEFLSEASRILGTSFDYHTTLATLARLAVPRLADYCAVDVLEDEADLVRLGVAHVDPVKEGLLLELSHFTTAAIPPEHPQAKALFERRSTMMPDLSREMVAVVLPDEKHQHIVEQLQARSLITVPLVVSDRVVGALTLVMSESDRRYNPDDLALAEELARRAAFAVENARLYHDAQQATGARDHVLAVVAHDLRNPLGTVLMASEMLLEVAADDHNRKHVQIIRRSADRMNRLIQDLLDVTSIESSKLQVEARPQNIRPLIEEAVAMLRPLAAGRSIVLESEVDDDLPLALFDGARILQVISNLVGNAIKFTPERGRIGIRCEQSGNEVRVAVIDTGPGIPTEQLPHLFGQFWQARSTDRRGIGLGLSIAKGIVEAHRGTIWVESEQGVGSTFYFTVPVALAVDDIV